MVKSVSMAGIVKFNVGGKVHTTTSVTLTSAGDNFLSRLVSHNMSSTLIDGAYFIDRDGKMFTLVLNYLRMPNHYELPSEGDTLRALRQEADFYDIIALVGRIDERLAHQSKTFMVDISCDTNKHNIRPDGSGEPIRSNYKVIVMGNDLPPDTIKTIESASTDTIVDIAHNLGYRMVNYALDTYPVECYKDFTIPRSNCRRTCVYTFQGI